MPLNIISIRSLSFTGTTWLNLVLGTARKAHAIGPPERLLRLVRNGEEVEGGACRACGTGCPKMAPFLDSADPGSNVFLQLASHLEVDHLVINNPGSEALPQLNDPGINIKELVLTRDGRGTACSHLKYNPDSTPKQTIKDWFEPAARSLLGNIDPGRQMLVRFEDILTSPELFLPRIASFCGLELPTNATKYWEHDIHPVAGNGGAIAMRRIHLGGSFPKKPEWHERYERLCENELISVEQDWRRDLDRETRLLFDALAGELNGRLGYTRDEAPGDATAPRRGFLGRAWNLLTGSTPEHPAHAARMDTEKLNPAACLSTQAWLDMCFITEEWNRLGHAADAGPLPFADASQREQIASILAKHAHDRPADHPRGGLVLDCGTGLSTVALARLADAPAIGIASSSEDLELASTIPPMDPLLLGTIRFEGLKDASRLPCPDASASWALLGTHAGSKDAITPGILADLKRVLIEGSPVLASPGMESRLQEAGFSIDTEVFQMEIQGAGDISSGETRGSDAVLLAH